MNPRVETNRLQLRPFTEEDIFDIYEFASNPNVAENAGWKPHTSIADSREIYEKVLCQPFEWAVVLKEEHKVIGSISISEDLFIQDQHIKMIGYLLNEDYWQQGYMYEAISALLKIIDSRIQVVAYHFPENLASGNLLKKLGFEEQAYITGGFKHYSGKNLDLISYVYKKQ